VKLIAIGLIAAALCVGLAEIHFMLIDHRLELLEKKK